MNRVDAAPPPAGRTRILGVAAGLLLIAALIAPPWLLSDLVGWPLPTRLPTPADVLAVLNQQPTTTLLIRVLACICWLAWASFAIDVLTATAATLLSVLRDGEGLRSHHNRRRRLTPARTSGGSWRPGAALVGFVVLALLTGPRPAPASATPAPPTPTSQLHTTTPAHLVDLDPDLDPDRDAGDGQRNTVQVRPPTSGIHDSLWRIAERELGDGNRWPELYALNKGQPQPEGRTLIRPELIHPGWNVELPEATSTNDTHPGTSPETGPTSPSDGARSSEPLPIPDATTNAPAPPEDGKHPQPITPIDDSGLWIEIGPGVAISAGLTAAVVSVLAAARRRRHRAAGASRDDDPPFAPIIREVAAHFPTADPVRPVAHDGPDDQPEWIELDAVPARAHPPVRDVQSTRVPAQFDPSVVAGEGPWEALLWQARDQGGLGVAGPGAHGVLRALLVELLFTPAVRSADDDSPEGASVAITEAFATAVGLPIDSLLAAAPQKAHIISLDHPNRGPTQSLVKHNKQTVRPLVVLADEIDPIADVDGADHTPGSTKDRAHAVVVLGPAPHCPTMYVRADGTIVTSSTPGLAALGERRLPVLDLVATTELLDLVVHSRNSKDDPPVVSPDEPPAPHPHPSDPNAPLGGEPASPADDNATTPTVARTPWALLLLGRPTLLYDTTTRPADHDHGSPTDRTAADWSPQVGAKMMELLVFLALHPHGTRRDTVVAALWPDTSRRRPANNLSVLIARLRNALRAGDSETGDSETGDTAPRPDIVTVEGEIYRIDPTSVTVDYWNFLAATALQPRFDTAEGSRPGTTLHPETVDALRTAHDLYRGPLADGVDTEWILSVREATRRTFLTASAHLVRHFVATQPDTALHLLEHTTRRDDVNEKLYHDIIALQLKRGDNIAAAHTHRLLLTLLADAEQTPSAATHDLARTIHEKPHRYHPPARNPPAAPAE